MIVDLIEAALAVRQRAHAPYSRFQVGAAIRDEHGAVHAGCNVENAAYPQGWCAETSAIAAMVASGARRVAELVVAGPGPLPCVPCGGCRQKLREFAAPDLVIRMVDHIGTVLLTRTLGDLLPDSFGPEHLA